MIGEIGLAERQRTATRPHPGADRPIARSAVSTSSASRKPIFGSILALNL